MARLEKIDQMHHDLRARKTDVDAKNQTIGDMTQKAMQSFTQFDEARHANLQSIQAELQLKKGELQDVKDAEAAQNAENNR